MYCILNCLVFRYALSRQGHKAAPMRLISPDEVSELVPILNMNNVISITLQSWACNVTAATT